jgi:hypothetical protein
MSLLAVSVLAIPCFCLSKRPVDMRIPVLVDPRQADLQRRRIANCTSWLPSLALTTARKGKIRTNWHGVYDLKPVNRTRT